MSQYVVKICEFLCPCLFKQQPLKYIKTDESEHEPFGEVISQNKISHDEQSTNYSNYNNVYSEQQTPKINQKLISEDYKKQEETILLDSNGQKLKAQEKFGSYIDCIPEQHPFYPVLSQKINLLPSIFNLNVDPEAKVPDTPYGLKIYTKQTQDEKNNIFVYTFVFPTTYEFYENMQNNFALQKSFDQNIDIYECSEIVDQNTKIIYLAYKKILIISPRDFKYVRYTFKKGQQYWSVATSLTDDQPIAGKTRGNIVLTVTKAIQKDDQLYLTVYSQVDMKMSMKPSGTKQRGVNEIKKYLDKCYAHIQQQKNGIL